MGSFKYRFLAVKSNPLAILLLLALTGCATFAPSIAPTTVKTIVVEPESNLMDATAENFTVMGRVSVRNAQHSFTGNVHWQHTKPEDSILLLSPLGQAVAEIKKNNDAVSLITAKQEEFHARNVEDLTSEILGWRLPLYGLQYWIQGQNAPTSTAVIELDDEDRFVAIRQDGWQILYLRYFTEQPDRNNVRPRIIELQYDDLKIRLVVDNWI